MLDDLRERIGADLKTAVKARAVVDVRALRALLGALDNGTAVEVPPARFGLGPTEIARRELTQAEVDAVIAREVGARREAVARYDALGLPGEADEYRREVAVLDTYLVRNGQ